MKKEKKRRIGKKLKKKKQKEKVGKGITEEARCTTLPSIN